MLSVDINVAVSALILHGAINTNTGRRVLSVEANGNDIIEMPIIDAKCAAMLFLQEYGISDDVLVKFGIDVNKYNRAFKELGCYIDDDDFNYKLSLLDEAYCFGDATLYWWRMKAVEFLPAWLLKRGIVCTGSIDNSDFKYAQGLWENRNPNKVL